MSNRTFVLGADDPEMTAIERLLSLAGEKWEYAKSSDGVRVNPGTAYKTMSPAPAAGQVWVECAAGWQRAADAPTGVTVVDHHRIGDQGFGVSPEKFWEASSIGQVWGLVAKIWQDGTRVVKVQGDSSPFIARTDIPQCAYGSCGQMWPENIYEDGSVRVVCHCDGGWGFTVQSRVRLQLIAAADHCLAAAYARKCPGIEPYQLMLWRLDSRASFQKKSLSELWDAMNLATQTLRIAPASPLGESVADLRDRHIDELPEASCRIGRGYLATIKDRDGRTKIVLGGCGEGSVPGTEPVRIFKEVWAPAQGLLEIYGDPVRGFAGGYLPA